MLPRGGLHSSAVRIASALVCVLLATSAFAETDAQKKARLELEKQLGQMVDTPPTRVRIDLVSLDEPNYALEEATFELDGRPLKAPALATLNAEGTHLVFKGDVAPGRHVVTANLAYKNVSSVIVSDEGGYTWRIGGDVTFEVFTGIEVQVQVTPIRDSGQKELKKRIRLTLPAKPVMLARMDDGTMPAAMKRPVIAPPDAGPSPEALAAAEKARLAEEAKANAVSAADAKRAAAEDAAEAKRLAKEAAAEKRRLAAEAKKQKAEDAKAARLAAAQEKKDRAEAAAAERLAAAEEKKRLAEGGAPTPIAEASADAGGVEPDAGAVAEAELDAGAPAIAEVAGPDAGVDAPAIAATPPAEEGLPSWLFAAGGGLVLLALLFVVARRRSRPPSLDE